MAAEQHTVTAVLPPALIRLFPGAEPRVELAAASVAEVIEGLDGRWPGMGDRIRDSRPAIRRHMNVFVGGKRATLQTALNPGTEVVILTAISGG